MKKGMLIFILIILSLMAVNSTLARSGEMNCPGHEGQSIASLRLCVAHAADEGHITNRGIVNSLFAKLDAAQRALDRGQPSVAINNLNSFINEVQAQMGKHIHADHAMHMIEHAQRVIAALGG